MKCTSKCPITHIGFDLDNVVFETHTVILDKINSLYHTDFIYNDITRYDLHEIFPITHEEEWDIIDYTLSQRSLPVVESAVPVLEVLARCYNIFFITHRPTVYNSFLHSQMLNAGFSFDYIMKVIDNNKDSVTPDKAKYIKDYNINLFVEDKPDTILDIKENTEATCLIYDRPWNRVIKESDRLIRVKNWFQIYWYTWRIEIDK